MNNIITLKDISKRLDSLIKTIYMSSLQWFISVRKLLLIRYICNNYEMIESKILEFGSNYSFNNLNQLVVL